MSHKSNYNKILPQIKLKIRQNISLDIDRHIILS